MHTQIWISQSLSSAATMGLWTFEVLPLREMVSLMMVDKTQTDKGTNQELLSCEIGPTNGIAIINKSGKKLKSAEQKGLQFVMKKGQCQKPVAPNC
jgi:hypothetical protein